MNWRKVGRGVAVLAALTAGVIACVVTYLLLTAESRLDFPDTPYPTITATTDPAVIERGRYLVLGPAHCSSCHATGDRMDPQRVVTAPLAGGLEFAMGPIATTWSANLTSDPETGLGSLTDAQIARTIRTGVTHDGSLSIFMRYSIGNPSDEDLTAILSYLRSMPPVPNAVPKLEVYTLGKLTLPLMGPVGPRTEAPPAGVPPSEEPSIARGEYLAEHVALCVACHSKFDQAAWVSLPPKAGGGTPEASHGDDSDMEFVTPNLTSHPTGVTGKLDEDAFVRRIRAGRVYPSSIMPWESFQATTDSDLRSIYRYLHSLPPVDNDVGPTYRPVGWTPPEGT